MHLSSHTLQLSIVLPADVVATITKSTSAVLELWAGRKLVRSANVLLVPASRADVAAELVAQEQVSHPLLQGLLVAMRVPRTFRQISSHIHWRICLRADVL